MASINSDIRVKNRNQGKVVAIILGLAFATLSLTFGLSFLPSFASAHTAVFDPTIVEESGQVDVQVLAHIAAGDYVKGILAGWSEGSLTCYDVDDVTNDTGDSITTTPGQLEFTMTAPAGLQDGGYPLFFKVTGTDDCSDPATIGTLQQTDDVLDVIVPEPTITHTSSTVVVKAADLDTNALSTALFDNSGKWFMYNDTNDTIDNTLGSFVNGPASSFGSGSIQFILGASPVDRKDIATFKYSGTALSKITTLGFGTYSHSGVAGANEDPYLNMNVDFTGTSGSFQSRLVYVPANNGSVTQDAWQQWDAINSGNAEWNYSGANWPAGVTTVANTVPGTTLRTWSSILADYPNARLLPVGGFLGVRVGEPGPDSYTANVDKFVIGITTDANEDTATYDFEPTAIVPVCSTGVGSPLLVDATMHISNDPDSSVSGPTWALDTFARHIQIWAEGDHYCAQADDNGAFTTVGGADGVSPQGGAVLPNVITGTMVGGTHGEITGTFNADAGVMADPDCSVSGACDSLTSKWVAHYFGESAVYAYSPSPADATGNWAWTYNACGHGTWVNANAGNSGDILAAGDDCAAPTAPADTTTNTGGGSGNNNGGGGVIGGPNGIGYVNTNPTNGGLVLGTSTEALPEGCDLYINTYLKMGAHNDMGQVMKLQTFLNANLGAGLPVTGVFGPMTFAAVKSFQLKHWDNVLAPWVPFGLESDHTATGYVYKTTQRMINLVQCNNTIVIPQPMLP